MISTSRRSFFGWLGGLTAAVSVKGVANATPPVKAWSEGQLPSTVNASLRKLMTTVDVYDSDFGALKVAPYYGIKDADYELVGDYIVVRGDEIPSTGDPWWTDDEDVDDEEDRP